jgi:tRNA(Ile)-lysidine synthase
MMESSTSGTRNLASPLRSMALDSDFPRRFTAAWPPEDWHDLTVLVAVSGGPDSVALLRAMAGLKSGGAGRLVVAHFNHQLRAAESDADQQFVTALAAELGLAVELGSGDVRADAAVQGDGLEAAARDARYQFLTRTAERLGARYLVTGHTADDQAETILHRVVRGTGLAGLSGMCRARPLSPAVTLLRPLLGFRRRELLDYLASLGQPYRHDASNLDPRFTRSRIREELLPQLARQYNPQVHEALLRLGELAAEAQGVMAGLIATLAERCVKRNGDDAVEIDVRGVAQQPRHLVRELLIAVWKAQGWPQQAMGYDHWDQLAELTTSAATAGKRMFPGPVLAERDAERLRLTRARAEA